MRYALFLLCLAMFCGASERGSERAIVRMEVPVFPPLARTAQIQGEVVLDATISKEGNVLAVQRLSGHPMLAADASENVRTWVFTETQAQSVERVVFVYKLTDTQQFAPCSHVSIESAHRIVVTSDRRKPQW